MRIYIKLTENTRPIPYNYQELLTGVIHKWIGPENDIHGKSGQFSFSWLQNTIADKNGGINLKQNAFFFISSPSVDFIKLVIKGITQDPTLFHGVVATDVQIANEPEFSNKETFFMASPVLLKVIEEGNIRHITLDDEDFEEVLTSNFKRKLENAALPSDGVSIRLNPETSYRRTKLITYKGIKNKTTFAPIVIEGTPEQIAFAWNVGLGNSTGIGLGALK